MSETLLKAVFAVSALALAACSSGPATPVAAAKTDADTAKQAPAGPIEPIAAKDAYWKMYTPAHAWAADITPIGLKSGEVTGVKNADGKAGVWKAVFASASKRSIRTYVYAVADQLPDITKGVKAELAEPWTGPTRDVMTFQTGDFKVDSDAAFKTATAKAADWLKQKDNAEKPVSLSLGASAKYQEPVWAILFGTQKIGYLALVSASNGEVVSK
jgi:hypothetical protein